MEEVHSIRLALEPGELVIELDNVQIIDCEELVGNNLQAPGHVIKAITGWLKHRSTPLCDDIIDRWGFANNPTGLLLSGSCSVKRIVLCSGLAPRSPPPGYYASSVRRGGWTTFWEIDFYTLKVRAVPRRIVLSDGPRSPEIDDIRSCASRLPQFEVTKNPQRYATYMDQIDEWCLANQDQFLAIFAPGDRPPSTRAARLYRRDIPTFCVSKHGDCLRAALVNSVHIIDGAAAATRTLHRGAISAASLAEGVSWLEREIGSYHGRIPITTGDLITWLMNQTEGVFILHLEGRGVGRNTNNHIVVVNAAEGVVCDCVERFSMRLTADTIGLCIGDGFTLGSIAEIRQIEKQAESKEGKKKRKNNPDKRREKRKMQRELRAPPPK